MNLPTQLTLLRVLLTPVFLLLFFHESLSFKLISFVVFIIASLTDWYDGYFAKKLGKVSQFGKFFDPLADKILVSSAFIAFYYQGYVKLWMVVVIVVRDFLITALRSYALFTTRPVVTSGLARAKTFLQMVSVFAIFVVYLLDHYATSSGRQLYLLTLVEKMKLIDLLLWCVIFLTVYTGLRYLIENRAHLLSIVKACYHALIPSDFS